MDNIEYTSAPLEETTNRIEGVGTNRLSDLENDYLDEAIETKDAQMIVNRIDEICYCVPPKAVDSNPEISGKLEGLKEGIDKQFLEAPNDLEQVSEISERMTGIEGTRYEDWQQMSPQERLDSMQRVENAAADIEHRPAYEVRGVSLGQNYFGFCDYQTKSITLNTDYLDGSLESYKSTLNTIIHEGRHAYQNYNIEERQVHPNDSDCADWRNNFKGYGYQSPQEVGFERYWKQPVEVDARNFAEKVINKFDQIA